MVNYMDFQGPSFRMEVPTDWFISSSPQFQAIFVAPVAGEVRTNLLISLRRVEEGVTARSVAEATRKMQEREYANYEVLSEKVLASNGVEDFLRVYKWYDQDKQVDLVQQQAFFVADRVLYTLTATRPDDEEAAKLDDTISHMSHSFTVKMGIMPDYREYSQ